MIDIYTLLFLPAMLLLKFLLSLTITSFPAKGVSWSEANKWHHPSMKLSNDLTYNLAYTAEKHYEDFNTTLDAILIPRVPGTDGHIKVRKYIVEEMKNLGWHVEEDSFTDRTPHGKKPFTNIVATLNPLACRRLVLACHYDSLYNREYTFLGATDSAVPCAMMIHLAKVLDPLLKEQKDQNHEVSLQLIFFDGEEAFHKWGPTDSLYGSRHLCEKWDKMKFPTGNDGMHCSGQNFVSYLDRIDVLVLLDLIGTANPKFYNYFLPTRELYKQLVEIEQRLNAQGLIETHPPEEKTNYFDSRYSFSFVEDDHVPFMKKDVPIVHLIPSPFPQVWHHESDNRENLHHPTISNLNKMLRVFIVEYLHLNVPLRPLVM